MEKMNIGGNIVNVNFGSTIKRRRTSNWCSRCSVDGDPSLSPDLRILKKRIFEAMPQSPHYAPLQNYNSEIRQGMKLGLDVVFIKLAQEIQNLVDPQNFWSKIVSLREQLIQLEEMGYDVKKLTARLADMQELAECERVCGEMVEAFKKEVSDHEIAVINQRIVIESMQEKIRSSESLIVNRRAKIEEFKNDSRAFAQSLASLAKSNW